MPSMGAPTKLTADTQQEFLAALRTGCTRKDAARYVGVHPDTVYTWLKRGAEPDAEDTYREFHRLVYRAERTVKIRALGFIQQAQETDWKAAAWWLERKHPDEFGRRDRLRVDATAQITASLTVQDELEATLADPASRELLDQLAIRGAQVNLAKVGDGGAYSDSQKGSSTTHGHPSTPGARVEGQPGRNGAGAGGS